MPADLAPEDQDLPLGCGCLDSSHKLQCGLMVHERPAPDTLAAELPLVD